MSAALTSWPVALGLLVWGIVTIALARQAEFSVTRVAPPKPWTTSACVLTLAVLAVNSRPTAAAAACGAACVALAVAAAADARTGYLFDAVTFPAAALVATIAIATGSAGHAASGVLTLVAPFGSIVAYSRGRWMGFGDVKAMYALGAAFGPIESPIAILAACVSGILTATLSGNVSADREVRFGPHLAAGAAFALVAGDSLARRLVSP